jgi:SAM-dependent methyltransferase
MLKSLLPPGLRRSLSAGKERLLLRSLRSAAAEQGLADLAQRLRTLAGDLGDQYSTHKIDSEFLKTKVAVQQAFQMSLAGPALNGATSVVDIGDSSGRHIQCLKKLYPLVKARWLSVNLDATAVTKIRAKGLEAVQARAEELDRHGVEADVFLLFETLEHLSDPFNFLHRLSSRTKCRRLVLTVPFVRRSRLGLHHVRAGLRETQTAERVHLLELSPEDLRLLFAHTGWKVVEERTYLQYPLRSPMRATKALWAQTDFEGFYGAVLARDDSWSSLYGSWPE